MKRLATALGLITLLTIVVAAPQLSIAAAPGGVIIARGGGYTNTGNNSATFNGYTFYQMSATGSVSALSLPSNLGTSPFIHPVAANNPMFVLLVPPDHIEILNLTANSDRYYSLPPGVKVGERNPPLGAVSLDAFPVNGGQQVLIADLDYDSVSYPAGVWYILDLASGHYSTITPQKGDHGDYQPFAQSPADGKLYAEWNCRCDAGPGGIMRYDLQGNGKLLDLHLGRYIRSTAAQMSPLGKYLYFLALDPDQPHPTRSGPGVDANIILRYRLSDSKLSVVARATAHNMLGSYTLTSPDDYLTYTQYSTVQDNPYDYHATGGAIKRVNLATMSQPQTLVTGASIGSPLWCGTTLYYVASAGENKPLIRSYNLATHKSAQADGLLVGCAR